MRNRIQYWTALFLLVMSGAAFGAQIGSLFCQADVRLVAPDIAKSVTVSAISSTSTSVDVGCPLATMADFVAAPIVMSSATTLELMRPAYIAALYLSPRYRVDPQPPTKPPSA